MKWTFQCFEEFKKKIDKFTYPAVVKVESSSGRKGFQYVGSRSELYRAVDDITEIS